MHDADDWVQHLKLQQHPEGGWFRETWRAEAADGERASATLIHFLLEAGQKSHWHRVDAAEIWLWHAGDPLDLWLAGSDDGPVRAITLGPDIMAGHTLQHVVEPQEWQGAMPKAGGGHGYALVSCAVAPGFEFSGFTLAPPDWAPGCGRAPQ